MPTITIPKNITGQEELVVMPRKEYEKLVKGGNVSEDYALRWLEEAKSLKKRGKLPVLKSLRDLR